MAAVLVDEAPEFERRDGLVYITDQSGTRAMRLRTFYATFHNAAACLQQCHDATGAEIIKFPPAKHG